MNEMMKYMVFIQPHRWLCVYTEALYICTYIMYFYSKLVVMWLANPSLINISSSILPQIDEYFEMIISHKIVNG